MSFRTNTCQQISLNDKLMNLTEREKKALDKSWAKIFADEIFPAIDEERFSVLYSDKASRPNTPINVIIGALNGVDLYHDCVKDSIFYHQRNDDMQNIIQMLLFLNRPLLKMRIAV